MPFDPDEDRGIPPKGRDEWITYALFLGTMGLCFVLALVEEFEPKKLSLIFFCLAHVAFTFVHEASHALAAWLLDWHVEEIVVGSGKPIASFKAGSIPVRVCLLPLSGYVRTFPNDLVRPRLKSAAIYFAGPGSSLVIVAAIALLVGPDVLLSASNNLGLIGLQSVALAGIVNAIPNLMPLPATLDGRNVPNDGLGIIQSFLASESAFALRQDAHWGKRDR
ncbi:MAG: M50 family metallopeptidase [Cyanobacteria bacterium J06641_5]